MRRSAWSSIGTAGIRSFRIHGGGSVAAVGSDRQWSESRLGSRPAPRSLWDLGAGYRPRRRNSGQWRVGDARRREAGTRPAIQRLGFENAASSQAALRTKSGFPLHAQQRSEVDMRSAGISSRRLLSNSLRAVHPERSRNRALVRVSRRDGARSGWIASCQKKFPILVGTAIRLVSGLTTPRWSSKRSAFIGEPRAWLDETGRPISDDAKVEERFHRVDHDNMEWTVTIDDPQMYTKPWVAMNKFPMKLQSPNFDIWGKYQQEMICCAFRYQSL